MPDLAPGQVDYFKNKNNFQQNPYTCRHCIFDNNQICILYIYFYDICLFGGGGIFYIVPWYSFKYFTATIKYQ